jgi:hypothetical protein
MTSVMLTSARNVVAVAASIAIVGAGLASAVGQVRQRRRPRAYYDSTLPTASPGIGWEKVGLRKSPFRRSQDD